MYVYLQIHRKVSYFIVSIYELYLAWPGNLWSSGMKYPQNTMWCSDSFILSPGGVQEISWPGQVGFMDRIDNFTDKPSTEEVRNIYESFLGRLPL